MNVTPSVEACTISVDPDSEEQPKPKNCQAEAGENIWVPTSEFGPDRVETVCTLIARGVAASEDQSPFAFAAGALLQISEDLFLLTAAYCEDDDVPGRLRTAIFRLSERASAASELSYRFHEAKRMNGGM